MSTWKKIAVSLLAICLLFTGCSKKTIENTSEENVLLTVNGEKIYAKELEQISPKYEDAGLTQEEILEGMVLELLTLQQADTFSITVSQDEVDSRFHDLTDLESLFYEKALEQYNTEEQLKKALYYKLVINKVSDKVDEMFCNEYVSNNKVMLTRTSDYVSKYTDTDFEENDLKKEDFSKEVLQTYKEGLSTELESLYFKSWQYKLLKESHLTYVDYDDGTLFQKTDYNINKDSLNFKGETYDLTDISLEEMQERFGNYLYLPNSVKDTFNNIEAKSVHRSEKDVRGLYITLGDDSESEITIKLIVSPMISFFNDFQGNEIVTDTEDGLNKIEFIQPDMGIYYSIIADREYDELESLLYSYIPYSKVDSGSKDTNSLDIITSLENYSQEVELTDGHLFFNSFTPIENDISYFNPDSAHLEQWDTEQVIDYLGAAFIPSFIPDDLKLYQDSYNDVFISEYTDNTMYWTVAYEEDSIIFDNFGIYYSNSFEDTYDPLRRKLFVEVSKNKIPQADVIYNYDATEISKIKDYELTVGLYKMPYYEGNSEPAGHSEKYIAEFTIHNVGYRIISENLTQKEFIQVLLSMPVFQ